MTDGSIPTGFHSVTPYLLVENVSQVIEFAKTVFGASEMMRLPRQDGSIMHAEIMIGNSIIMLKEPRGNFHPMPAMNYVHVADCDVVFGRAVAAGGSIIAPLADQFWGSRGGVVRDAQGNIWFIATHKENVPPDELARRALAAQATRG